MAEETPLDRQWQYLEALRAEDTDGADSEFRRVRPAQAQRLALTQSIVFSLKG
jgi:putative ATP-dependent endonuclease of OLD family